MISCGPYQGLTKIRETVKCKCTNRCKYFDLCKNELNLPKDWKGYFWFDRESTEQEQLEGRYHEILVDTPDEGVKVLRRTWEHITWAEKRKRERNGNASWTNAMNSFQLLSGYGTEDVSFVEQLEKETTKDVQ